MFQGVLFDMDGVLFDTERLTFELCDGILRARGYRPPQNYLEQTCGVNHDRYRAVMYEMFGEDFPFDDYNEEAHGVVAAHLTAHGVPVKPGLFDLLEYLRARAIPVAVASSTRYETILGMLKSAGVQDYFAAVVGGDMVQNSKPDPEIFRKAAQAIGLNAADCVAVEDSFNGVRSAAAAGCTTIMVPDMIAPTEEIRALADVVLPSLCEVPAYLDSLAGG